MASLRARSLRSPSSLLVLAALGCSAPERSPPGVPATGPRVELDTGIVEGLALAGAPGHAAFLGIPYASPPLGPARWKPPEPVAPWSGIRGARTLGSRCPQPDVSARERRYALALGRDPSSIPPHRPTSEDCLFLHVWTTNLGGTAPLPVLVWIHGGSYRSGSGGDEPASLAVLGVVVVTINYRLGVLGFLAHPALTAESPHHASGNYGLLDQIAALRWVQRNIAAFGGDPTRVTVAGHSSGGGAVLQLIASPLARGLLHRGIAQSAALGMSRPLAIAEADGVAIATRLGAPADAPLPALRAAPVQQLVAALPGGIDGTTDGWVLPTSVPEALRTGLLDHIPLIVGATADEADIFAIPALDRTAYEAHIRAAEGQRRERVLALYSGGTDATTALRRYMTDRDFLCPARYTAARRRGHTWLYRFSLPPKPDDLGAFHGSELPLLFAAAPISRGAAARAAEAMRSYWARFAATGNPDQPGLPSWPTYRIAPPRLLEIGDPVRIVDDARHPGCDVFDEAWGEQ
jgi:para-nitrobenzyl esterase